MTADEQRSSVRGRLTPCREREGLTSGELLRILPAAVIVGAVSAAVGGTLATRLGAPGGLPLLAIAAACALVGFWGGIRFVSGFANGMARGVGGFILSRGSTTPPAADYSKEDALVMQRDIAGALASYEATLAADPSLADARLRAADLYAGEGNDPRRAEALFREVQRLPGVTVRDDLYASSRLVDLYAGVLEDTGRAVVELRRLIERHPQTRAAEDARRGLATLKARLTADRADAPPPGSRDQS